MPNKSHSVPWHIAKHIAFIPIFLPIQPNQAWLKEAIRKVEENTLQEAAAKARAAREAAMQSLPPMKMEQQEFHDGHSWLARECRKSPIHVDTDVASHGWTNWEVKKEPLSHFGYLRPAPKRIIVLDSPSPVKLRKGSSTFLPSSAAASSTSAPSRPVPNPENALLGLPSNDEPDDSLEEAIEQMMDEAVDMPEVGEAPDEEG